MAKYDYDGDVVDPNVKYTPDGDKYDVTNPRRFDPKGDHGHPDVKYTYDGDRYVQGDEKKLSYDP